MLRVTRKAFVITSIDGALYAMRLIITCLLPMCLIVACCAQRTQIARVEAEVGCHIEGHDVVNPGLAYATNVGLAYHATVIITADDLQACRRHAPPIETIPIHRD
jgi:hypothetical protein